MVFNSLSLFNFKNFESAKADFISGINCLVGSNGVGKTNILDALHYLSLGKSAINPIDTANIRYNEDSFFIKSGVARNNSTLEVLCTVQNGKKKSLKVNQEEYTRLSEHVGYLPVVMISPNDNSLIIDGNEARRKFFDSTISQIDRQYLYNLVRYQKALKQRNALLKEFSQQMNYDDERLAPYDHELLGLAGELYTVRSKFLKKFESRFDKLYKKLSHEHEKVSIAYESHWQQDDPENMYRSALKKDLALHRTTVGVHRDAYHFMIDDKPIKRFGSQGQQKSLIVSLKVAQFQELKKAVKVTPVLLLDDIFDKLDDQRMAILLKMVCANDFGQIFLTDARPERTRTMLADNKLTARIFTINDGVIETIEDYEQ
jgi:DNA replication and repair protein RecF